MGNILDKDPYGWWISVTSTDLSLYVYHSNSKIFLSLDKACDNYASQKLNVSIEEEWIWNKPPGIILPIAVCRDMYFFLLRKKKFPPPPSLPFPLSLIHI